MSSTIAKTSRGWGVAGAGGIGHGFKTWSEVFQAGKIERV